METNLPSCFSIQFLEQLLKFLVDFTLLKYVKSQRNYGFLITTELIFGFQILDLKDHLSASLIKKEFRVFYGKTFQTLILRCCRLSTVTPSCWFHGSSFKGFSIIFLFSDWLKSNHLKSCIERGFVDIF